MASVKNEIVTIEIKSEDITIDEFLRPAAEYFPTRIEDKEIFPFSNAESKDKGIIIIPPGDGQINSDNETNDFKFEQVLEVEEVPLHGESILGSSALTTKNALKNNTCGKSFTKSDYLQDHDQIDKGKKSFVKKANVIFVASAFLQNPI